MAKIRSLEDFYRLVAAELAAGRRDERLWLETYVQEQGNEAVARQRYVQTRAERLMWLANGPGSETNTALPLMGLPPRKPRNSVAKTGSSPAAQPAPAERAATSLDGNSSWSSQVRPADERGQFDMLGGAGDAASSGIDVDHAARPPGARMPLWAKLAGGTIVLFGIVAIGMLMMPEKRSNPPPGRPTAVVATDKATHEAGAGNSVKGAEAMNAGIQATSARQAEVARRLLGKWECISQASAQGEKFHYFYEFLPDNKVRFLGAETRWLVAGNLHLLEEASGPEVSRADGFMEYRLDWENDERYVRTEINYRSTVICSRAAKG